MPFRLRLLSEGGTGAVTWRDAGIVPPSGLSLSPDGVLSGIPDQVVTVEGYQAVATDSAGKRGKVAPFTIQIAPLPVIAVSDVAGKVGKVFELGASATNLYGTSSWSLAGVLPLGLSFDTKSGGVRGFPREPGRFEGLRVSVRDADGATSTSNPFTIAVASTLEVSGLRYKYGLRTGRPITPVVPTAVGSAGTPGWSLLDAARLPVGLSFDPASGALVGTPTVDRTLATLRWLLTDGADGSSVASYPVEITVQNEPSAVVPTPVQARVGNPLRVVPQVAGLVGDGRWFVEGALPAGVSVNDKSGDLVGVPLARGTSKGQRLKVLDLYDGKAGTSNPFDVVVNPTLAIAMPTIPTGQVGQPYYVAAPPVTGLVGTPRFGIGLLPGLSYNAATGEVSGVPQVVPEPRSTTVYTVTDAADGATAATGKFQFPILPPGAGPVFRVPDVPDPVPARRNAYFTYTPVAEGTRGKPADISWELSGYAPSWLYFEPSTGRIYGTPDAVGDVPNLRLTAKDASVSASTGSNVFRIAVAPAAPMSAEFVGAVLAVSGVRYESDAPAVRDAEGAVTFELVSGTFPDGLSFDAATGRVVGTAEVPGDYGTIVIRVVDAAGATATSPAIPVKVEEGGKATGAGVVASVQSDLTASVGKPFKTRASYSGFGSVPSWSLASGTLPGWLALDAATGTLSGIPDQDGVLGPYALLASTSTESARTNDFGVTVSPKPLLVASMPKTTVGAVNLDLEAYASYSGFSSSPTWSLKAGTLPPGLALDANAGAISGVPTRPATAEGLVLTAEAPGGETADTPPFSVVVKPSAMAVTMADATVRSNAPLSIAPQVSAKPLGMGAWSLKTGTLPAGISLEPNAGGISGKSTAEGSYPGLSIAYTVPNRSESVSNAFTVNVTKGISIEGLAPSYALRQSVLGMDAALKVLNAKGSIEWKIENFPAGVSMAGGRISGVPSRSGNYNAKVTATDLSDGAVATATTTVSVLPELKVGAVRSVQAHRGAPFSLQAPSVTGQAGPTLSWSLAGTVPPFLGVDAGTGIASSPGAPDVGTFDGIRLKAVDSTPDMAQSTSDPFKVEVLPPLQINDMATLYLARLGKDLRTFPPTPANVADGVTWSWDPSSAARPAWARIDPATGSVVGTPDALGTYPDLRIRARDAWSGIASIPFTLVVQSQPSVTLEPALTDVRARIGDVFEVVPTAKGVSAAPAWGYLASPALPAGLAFDGATGKVSGAFSVAAPGASTLAVTATDPGDKEVGTSTQMRISVADRLSLATAGASYVVRQGAPLLAAAPVLTGARGEVSYSVRMQQPVPGLIVTPQEGILRGVPETPAPAQTVTLVATDAWDDRVATATVGLEVKPGIAFSAQPGDVTVAPGASVAVGGGATNVLGKATYAILVDGAEAPNALGACGLSLGTDGVIRGTARACSVAGLLVRAVDDWDGSTAYTGQFDVVVTDATAQASPPSVSVVEGSPVSVALSTSIPRATWTLAGAPAWLSVDGSGRAVGMAPDVSSDQSYTVTATAARGTLSRSATFTLSVRAATVTVADLPSLMMAGDVPSGQASSTFVATPTWTLVGAPDGLTIGSDGKLGGRLAQLGTFSKIKARATVAGAIAESQPFSIVVRTANSIVVSTATYGATCGVQAGNWTGFAANACDGLKSCSFYVPAGGDPAVGCNKTFDMEYTCLGTSGTRQVHLGSSSYEGGGGVTAANVSCDKPDPGMSVVADRSMTARANAAFRPPMSVGGSPTLPVAWRILDGRLPSGLSIPANSTDQTIGGTPTAAAARTTVNVSATDANGFQAFAAIDITVLAALSGEPPSPRDAPVAGKPYTLVPVTNGLPGKMTWDVVDASGASVKTALAASGLSFDVATGTISGTPDANLNLPAVYLKVAEAGTGATATSAGFGLTVVRPATPTAWNSGDMSVNTSLTNSSLAASNSGPGYWNRVRAYGGKTTGKWYFESTSASYDVEIGLAAGSVTLGDRTAFGTSGPNAIGYYSGYGWIRQGGDVGYQPGWNNRRAMVAYDADAGRVWFGVNGQWVGDPAAGTGGYPFKPAGGVFPAGGAAFPGTSLAIVSQGFTYAPPAGFTGWTQ